MTATIEHSTHPSPATSATSLAGRLRQLAAERPEAHRAAREGIRDLAGDHLRRVLASRSRWPPWPCGASESGPATRWPFIPRTARRGSSPTSPSRRSKPCRSVSTPRTPPPRWTISSITQKRRCSSPRIRSRSTRPWRSSPCRTWKRSSTSSPGECVLTTIHASCRGRRSWRPVKRRLRRILVGWTAWWTPSTRSRRRPSCTPRGRPVLPRVRCCRTGISRGRRNPRRI